MPDMTAEERVALSARLDDVEARSRAAVIALEASPDLARKIIALAEEVAGDA